MKLGDIVDPETLFDCFLHMQTNTTGLYEILDKLNQFGRDSNHSEDYVDYHAEIVAHLV